MIPVNFNLEVEPRAKPARVHFPAKAWNAGARGEPATMNPHQAGTPAWRAWMSDWADGWLKRRFRFEG